MVQKTHSDGMFYKSCPERLFYPQEQSAINFTNYPNYTIIENLIYHRAIVLNNIKTMPPYLFKTEVLRLLEVEKHPTYRLIIDIIWSTGALISEVLALTPMSFIEENNRFWVTLKTLNQRSGRPTKASLNRISKRKVLIHDPILQDRILSYLEAGHYKKKQHIFPMARQTVNRHIKSSVEKVGGAPFSISSYTFRHSFAIHLLLHGLPEKHIRQLLGQSDIKSTEIYTNVFPIDYEHFLEGVDFH